MVRILDAVLATASLAGVLAAPAELVERQNVGLNYNQNWGDGPHRPSPHADHLSPR